MILDNPYKSNHRNKNNINIKTLDFYPIILIIILTTNTLNNEVGRHIGSWLWQRMPIMVIIRV